MYNPLPTEVRERVINFLRQDSKTLHSCLLTCRAWVLRSNYHLYTSVRLSTPAGLSLFLRSLHSVPGNAQFVHSLTLSGSSHYSTLAIQDDDDLMVTAAICLPRILTSLREIKLIGRPVDMHTTFPRLLSQFQAITQLSLESTTFTSFNEFKRHILAFPNLKHLCLFNATWMVRRQPIPSSVHHLSHTHFRRSRPALERVKIYYEFASDGVLVEDTTNWLLTTETTSTLAELSVGPLNVQSTPVFNHLLSACQNSLHTLEIYCEDSDRMRLHIGDIDLRNNLTLRDFRIYDVDADNFASLLLAFLPSLRSLSIRVLCDFEGQYTGDSDPAWKMVTSALTYGHLDNAETIRIRLVDIDSGVAIYGDELRAAPGLHPRVVLTDYSGDDQPYKPKTLETSWTMKLENLSRRLGRNDALALSEARHDKLWGCTYTVSGVVYGRGTSQTLHTAKQMAAYQTHCTWLTKLCACPPDEFRQKYKHIFR